MRFTEAQLDSILAKALLDQEEFSTWFFKRTRFGNESARCVFCRSDNPWSSVRLPLANAVDRELGPVSRECETDVLAVYAATDGRRLALHIENKLAGGSFTEHQALLYEARLQQWKGRPRLGNYDDGTSVLVAPLAFYDRNRAEAAAFETFISHEELGTQLSAFGSASRADA